MDRPLCYGSETLALDEDTGLMMLRDESANSAEVMHLVWAGTPHVTTESTFAHATTLYSDLLRRLAD
jgi:hypothetical protein